MQIVPAIYLKDGKLAAYKPGNYNEIEFLNQDPYDFISKIDKLEIETIGMIDVDSTLGDHTNTGLIGSLANVTVADVYVGGGILEMEYLKSLQFAGVNYFILGTAVFEKPEFLKTLAVEDHVQNDKVVVSLDILDGQVTYHGWTESSDISIKDLIAQCQSLGFDNFIINDVHEDQSRGPNLSLFKALIEVFPNGSFVASGQIRSFEDIESLGKLGVKAVVVGNQIYKKKGLLERIAAYNKTQPRN